MWVTQCKSRTLQFPHLKAKDNCASEKPAPSAYSKTESPDKKDQTVEKKASA
jgi:hypothetical protein